MKRLFSLLLVTILLCGLFAIPATAATEGSYDIQDDYIDEALMYYIWLTLKAWGYDITINQLSEWNDATEEILREWIYEFLDDTPSILSWGHWVAPWAWAINASGMFQGNSSMLEDIQDFVAWLIAKMGGGTDPVFVNSNSFDFGDITCYETNHMYSAKRWSGDNYIGDYIITEGYMFLKCQGTDYYYFWWVNPEAQSNQYKLVFFDINSFSSMGSRLEMYYADGVTQDGSSFWLASTSIESGDYNWGYVAGWPGTVRGYKDVPFIGTEEQLDAWFKRTPAPTPSDPITWYPTGTLPDDSEDYDNGDGYIIVVDDNGYSVIYLNITIDNVTVENLPAGLIKNDVENPRYGAIWHYITDWKNDITESAKLVGYAMADAPSPILNYLWAILSIGIILGIIKVMRK